MTEKRALRYLVYVPFPDHRSLLLCSNVIMTLAWYGHLKFLPGKALWMVILISWGLAFFEYCLAIPANRTGYLVMSGFQLKVVQEVITIFVFSIFAILVLGEKLTWNYFVSFLFLLAAAWFAFGFQPLKKEGKSASLKPPFSHSPENNSNS